MTSNNEDSTVYSVAKSGPAFGRAKARVLLIVAWSFAIFGQSADALNARSSPGPSAVAAQISELTEPGTRFRDCRGCPLMIVIPSGWLKIASRSSDGQTSGTEARILGLDVPIAMGVFDVTVREYSEFVRTTGRATDHHCYLTNRHVVGLSVDGGQANWQSPGFRQTGDHPVVCVNRADTLAYVQWLNRQVRASVSSRRFRTDGPYRLPGADEWEYAARGGTTTKYYWGDQASRNNANFGLDDCNPCSALGSDRPAVGGKDHWLHTSPVGSFPPNPFGLYDMAGNVSQRTNDCLSGYYWPIQKSGPCKSGFLSNNDNFEYTKGGSWIDGPKFLESVSAVAVEQDGRFYTVGFRVVRDLD